MTAPPPSLDRLADELVRLGARRFLTGHVVVTVSWTVAALVLMVRGLTSVPVRTAGMSLVGAAVAKLVLFVVRAAGRAGRAAGGW